MCGSAFEQESKSTSSNDGKFKLVFIVGASRSGTTWLQSLLGEHSNIYTHSEIKLFSHYIRPLIHAWEWDEQDTAPHGLPGIWSHEEFYSFLENFIATVYKKVVDSESTSAIIVDKIPHSDDIERIETLISSPKYIHVVRDGRDVASSLIAASKGWGNEWAPSTVASAAKWWKFGVDSARVAKKFSDEGRYLEVRYEDMIGDCVDALENVANFLKLDRKNYDVEKVVENNRIEKMQNRKMFLNKVALPEGFIRKGKTGGWKESFSIKDQIIFESIAGNLLDEYGYERGPGWIVKMAKLIKFAKSKVKIG